MNIQQGLAPSAARHEPATTAPALTVLLPLKGRYLFTLRFLWYANRVRLPYRILVADGEAHPVLTETLQNAAALFPALDVQYIRYPDDTSFARYFAKMADALGRVTTPYVAIVDNDDFIIRSGADHCVDFLEGNPTYVCCGGGIAGFSVYSRLDDPLGDLLGPLNQLSYRYMPYDRSHDFSSESMTERLVSGLRNSWSFYAVFRTPALATIWRDSVDFDLRDLQLHEKFCAMRTLTLGKARSEASVIGSMRQYYTSMQTAFSVDWVHHLLRSRFSVDFDSIVDRISGIAAEADHADKAAVAEQLRERIEPWLRDFLRLNYGLSGTVRQYLRERVPGLLMWLKKRRRYSVARERRAVLGRLRQDHALPDYPTTFSRELADVEAAIGSAEVRAFIAPFVPKLQARLEPR